MPSFDQHFYTRLKNNKIKQIGSSNFYFFTGVCDQSMRYFQFRVNTNFHIIRFVEVLTLEAGDNPVCMVPDEDLCDDFPLNVLDA